MILHLNSLFSPGYILWFHCTHGNRMMHAIFHMLMTDFFPSRGDWKTSLGSTPGRHARS